MFTRESGDGRVERHRVDEAELGVGRIDGVLLPDVGPIEGDVVADDDLGSARRFVRMLQWDELVQVQDLKQGDFKRMGVWR